MERTLYDLLEPFEQGRYVLDISTNPPRIMDNKTGHNV